MRHYLFLLAVAFFSWGGIALVSTAKDPTTKGDKVAATPKAQDPSFIRIVRNDKKEVTALQTAVVRYVSKTPGRDGLEVDLVGAVHVGDRAYYDELNKAFEKYDVVLYELVAPEGTRVEKGDGKSRHPVGAIQNGMKDMLGLEHQLACVDYTKKNFVHADMSPDDFEKSMKDRGESIWSMIFKAMGAGMAQQSEGKGMNEFELLLALFDRNRSVALKRVLAEQFENMDGMMSVFDGPDGSTIITERNKKALEGLKKQIDAGQKKIAIFYGAGHLADMEKRLDADFKLKRKDEKWLTAWDIKPKASK